MNRDALLALSVQWLSNEGTEHVYMDVEASNSDEANAKLIQAMLAKHGSVKGIRFTPV